MTENTKSVPKRRFREFQNTGAWEQHKLGEIAKYRNGKAHENDIDENGKYIVVNSKFVSTDGVVQKFSNVQNEPLFENEIALVLSDVPNGRAIARTFLADKSDKYTLNQRIAGITPLENTNPYFLHILMNRNKYFLQFDDGAKQTNLSVDDVIKFEEFYPEKEEQQAIGDYFKQLDNLIALHKRKLEKMKALKSAYLWDMFPKEDERAPKRRFAGFTDPWEQRKLGELVEIGDIDHRMPPTVDSGIPYLMTGDFSGINELNFSGVKLISEDEYRQLSKKIKPEKDDIIFARYASVGAVRYVDFTMDFLISYSCAIIKSSQKIVSKFLYHFLTSDIAQKQIQLEINTGSQANIGIDSMKNNIIVTMPSYAEQVAISNYLSNLDNLITLHQRKLKKLQNIKKAYLNEMLI